MKNIKIIVVLMLGVAFFISCDSRTEQDLEGIVANPTYTKNIKPLMNSKCITCHSQGNQYPDMDTYDNIKTYLDQPDNELLCSIQPVYCTNPRMPKGGAPLSSGTITMVKKWIEQGYPEN